MTSYASIVALLKTALLLLSLAQGPNVPQSLHDQAVSVANQAIAAATQALGTNNPTTVTTVALGAGNSSAQTTTNSTVPTSSPIQTQTSVLPQTSVPTSIPPITKQHGWDYDLSKECAKSVDPTGTNYFIDATGCDSSGKNWTIAVQSEKTPGVSYPGPANQSFPINAQNSPTSIKWLSHTDEKGVANHSVELKTDFNSTTHPGGSGYFTWFALMDHANHNGGPLPRPDKLSFTATVNFNDFVPNGGTRAIVGFQGYWNGKSHLVEINFANTNWGDNNSNPDIVNVTKSDSLEYVTMDGTAMGISVPKLTDTKITVPWSSILQNLVARGLLEMPTGGWGNSASQTVFVATEVKNDTPTNSAVTDLWITNFRIEDDQ